MGERSFGKGLVQRYRNLTYGTQLKVTISKYYTPSGRCIQELDYANRNKDGKVPKFSDNGINEFKTANGRLVFDGGGVAPDVKITKSKRTEATKKLLSTRTIFNFVTDYFYKNPSIKEIENFQFKDSDFKQFTNYLKIDTSFKTVQEVLFQKAYESSKESEIGKEYQQIKRKLLNDKIEEISKNKDIIISTIEDEILERYYYKEGVYKSNLKNDHIISEATKLLKNESKYKEILSGK
jgi:carboxyl-terminal processing protease